jgi:hypothetical protein
MMPARARVRARTCGSVHACGCAHACMRARVSTLNVLLLRGSVRARCGLQDRHLDNIAVARTHARTHVRTLTQARMHAHTHTHAQTCTHTPTPTQAHADMRACTQCAHARAAHNVPYSMAALGHKGPAMGAYSARPSLCELWLPSHACAGRISVPVTALIRTRYCSYPYPLLRILVPVRRLFVPVTAVVRTPYCGYRYPLLRILVPRTAVNPVLDVRTPFRGYFMPLTAIIRTNYCSYPYPVLQLSVPHTAVLSTVTYCGYS